VEGSSLCGYPCFPVETRLAASSLAAGRRGKPSLSTKSVLGAERPAVLADSIRTGHGAVMIRMEDAELEERFGNS